MIDSPNSNNRKTIFMNEINKITKELREIRLISFAMFALTFAFLYTRKNEFISYELDLLQSLFLPMVCVIWGFIYLKTLDISMISRGRAFDRKFEININKEDNIRFSKFNYEEIEFKMMEYEIEVSRRRLAISKKLIFINIILMIMILIIKKLVFVVI